MSNGIPVCCGCGSNQVEQLCHLPPDPLFICSACGQQMVDDGTAWVAQPVLTIDTKDLRDLFLPIEREQSDALKWMNEQCVKACGGARYQPMHIARCALKWEWEHNVREVCRRGGLLLIGGKA